MGGGTEDVEVGDMSILTSFSIDGEYTPITSSEATQSLSNGLRGDSNGEVSTNLTGDCRPSSSTCCQPWHRPSRPADQHWVLERRSETLESTLVALFFGRLR
jgi:hypothetical protein